MRLWLCVLACLATLLAGPARAEIVVSFYSHELGSTFPHAFVTVKGTTDDGRAVDTNFGFTAKSVTPAVLMGSVAGEIELLKPKYVASSDRQFAVKVSDAQYRALLGVVEKWRTLPGKSYNLDKRNCIHFVGEIAATLGLKVAFPKNLIKKPRSFLLSLIALNPWVKP
jgi:hypothetical protein